jgi:hypothetical protein
MPKALKELAPNCRRVGEATLGPMTDKSFWRYPSRGVAQKSNAMSLIIGAHETRPRALQVDVAAY